MGGQERDQCPSPSPSWDAGAQSPPLRLGATRGSDAKCAGELQAAAAAHCKARTASRIPASGAFSVQSVFRAKAVQRKIGLWDLLPEPVTSPDLSAPTVCFHQADRHTYVVKNV